MNSVLTEHNNHMHQRTRFVSPSRQTGSQHHSDETDEVNIPQTRVHLPTQTLSDLRLDIARRGLITPALDTDNQQTTTATRPMRSTSRDRMTRARANGVISALHSVWLKVKALVRAYWCVTHCAKCRDIEIYWKLACYGYCSRKHPGLITGKTCTQRAC